MPHIISTSVESGNQPGKYLVEFVSDDGNRVSVLLENAFDLQHQEIVTRAKQLLADSSRTETANQSQAAAIVEQPEGPVPPAHPLLADYEPDGLVVPVEGEGMIDPEPQNKRLQQD